MTRVADIETKVMTKAQRAVFDRIAAGPRGTVEGPLRIWLHSPELADRSQSLGEFCRYRSSLPQILSELAILVIAAHWRAAFEWHVHAPIAECAGLPLAVIAAIAEDREPELDDPVAGTVFAFTRGLVVNRTVPQDVFDKALQRLGTVGVVDLVGVIGYYTYIAMTIIGFEVAVPDESSVPLGNTLEKYDPRPD